MPEKKKKSYEGKLEIEPSQHIYLNINYLKKGVYVLKILNYNKLIKETTFKK
ncbi:MAG: hypothetical protein R2781_05805 [Flavobacteriaceae bacterium]